MIAKRMLLEAARQAMLHSETYTAVLKGYLDHGLGRAFAVNQIGITPNYLSNLLNPDHDPPSPYIAEQLVAALPLETDRKLALLEHFFLAREGHQQMTQQLIPLWREPLLPMLLGELYMANDRAAQQGVSVRTHWYRAVVEVGNAILRQCDPTRNFLDYIQIGLIVQNALSVIDHHEEALYLAKYMTALMDARSIHDFWEQRERYHYLWINSWAAQVVAYRNLKLARPALMAAQQTAAIIANDAPTQANFWMPHTLRGQLESLIMLPRFTVHQVEGLVHSIQRACEKRDFIDTANLLRLTDKALLKAYTTYDTPLSLKKALRLARHLTADAFNQKLNVLDRAVIVAAMTETYHAAGDLDAWQWHLRTLVTLTYRAGLVHQLNKARRMYGTEVDHIVQDLEHA